MALSRSRGRGVAPRGWLAARKASVYRLAYTFLARGDGNGECRRVCELDRSADEIARATHSEGRFRARWSVYQNLEEEKGRGREGYGRRWYSRRRWRSQVVVVEQVVIVIMAVMVVVVVVVAVAAAVVVVMVMVAMVAGIRLAPFPR